LGEWVVMTTTDWIQAISAVISVFVALGAVAVAWKARGVATEANGIAAEARDIAGIQAKQTQRLARLAAVPHLAIVSVAMVPKNNQPRLTIEVENGGPSVAYGLLATAAGTHERSLEHLHEATRRQSGRQVALPAGQRRRLYVPFDHWLEESGTGLNYPWIAIRLEWYGPLGVKATQDYLWPTKPRDYRFRLHRMSIDPGDGSAPEVWEIVLGRFDQEDAQPAS